MPEAVLTVSGGDIITASNVGAVNTGVTAVEYGDGFNSDHNFSIFVSNLPYSNKLYFNISLIRLNESTFFNSLY